MLRLTIYVSNGEQDEELEPESISTQNDSLVEKMESEAKIESEPEAELQVYEEDDNDGQVVQAEVQNQSGIFDGGCANITEELVNSISKNGNIIKTKDPAYNEEERCTKIRGIVTSNGNELNLSLNGRVKVEDTTAEPWIITDSLDSVSIERVGAEFTGHMVELYGYFEMNRSSEHCTFVAYSIKKLCCE